MSDSIESYLKLHGPSLSSEISNHLVRTQNITPATARKRISRAKTTGKVHHLTHITFPQRTHFIYLGHQFGSQLFWEKLIEVLLQQNSAYGLAIAAVRQRRGLVPLKHFAIACGAPLKQARHLSPDTIFQRLEKTGLLWKTDFPGVGECILLVQPDSNYDSIVAYTRTRLITEKFLLLAIKDWLKKLGIVSYDKVEIREIETQPKVGTFVWDLTAPSYLGFMAKPRKGGKTKPGFVTCDVCLGDVVNSTGIKPFINKCVTLRALQNIGACMQIFVADKYTQDAFNLLKQKGIIPATPRNLFGEEVAEGLTALSEVLRKAAETAINPQQFDQLFDKLGKIEGASSQLRGTLFEYVVADVLRKNGSNQILMNRIFKSDDEKEAEADVISIKDNRSVTFVECKGYNPDSEVPDKYLERWLHHSIPIFFKWIKAHPDWRNLEVCFEFWTTGSLSKEALKMFNTNQKKIKKSRYTIELLLGREILRTCKSTKDKGLVNTFKKHFMKIYSE